MKLRKIALITLCSVTCYLSCNKDDDGGLVTVEIRDRAEQQVKDKDSLLEYLATHYYNSSEFEAIANPTIGDLKITELAEGTDVPDGSTLLNASTKLETLEVDFADVKYEYYILKLKAGGGTESPTFADNVVVKYEGFTLDDKVFDSAVNPVGFDLIALVPGWRKVLPQFNVAESFVENGDGTVSFIDQGIGVMFLPSGLGYFSQAQAGIPAYAPIAFKFGLLQMSQNDHDNDGIPSYLEDLDGDGEVFDENTDGDFSRTGSFIYNYIDPDDDGDGILTKDEITITTENRDTIEAVKAIPLESNQKLSNYIVEEENGTFTGTIITFTDSDGDGEADYLDAE
ncbi:FKBP-type peptidyl-prolyl cis-trans isomerase [Flavivirga sp. 57AJ16]|uniref:FKBP-type peptidyl-prolyl cis-trans isomerase n=1 Tax=Flavivirga sp. 57AJ16 TaxID=3025307 RepID=UPI002365EFE5|nr:hypothetical protein [Flavivirga sp. 57AJ16]MDD7887739.1 hypothetical protein [Flavivirga sp. 57AJ16]